MSIEKEIKRIKSAKEALKASINAKGGSITDEHLDTYSQFIDALDLSMPEFTYIGQTGSERTQTFDCDSCYAVAFPSERATCTVSGGKVTTKFLERGEIFVGITTVRGGEKTHQMEKIMIIERINI